MRASVFAVIVFTSMAQAEEPPAASVAATFDVIFSLPEVQSLTFDDATGTLYAAVSPLDALDGASVIVRWQLDPIQLDGMWPTGTLVSNLAVSPSGLVWAAGQRGLAPGQTPTREIPARFGSIINLDPNKSISPIADIIFYADNAITSVSRFNQVAFSNNGTVYIASPTQFSVAVRADNQVQVSGNLPDLKLTCGAPAQLSVFQAGERTGYVTSTRDGALLEAGAVDAVPDPYSKALANCFRVTNVFDYKEPPSTLNRVVHAVLADAFGKADAVLALEPNTGTLHLLRLDPDTPQLARADRAELEDQNEVSVPGAFNLIAASRDGSVIFVGGQGRENVLRFRRDGDHLHQIGTLLVGSGLRSVTISPDGGHAALVISDVTGHDRIHLVREPGHLGDGWQRLPSSGSTLQQVQSELTALGYSIGPADGMLGPRTLSAIDQLLKSEANSESFENEVQLMIDGVLLTRRLH